jgi:isoamylase
VFNGAAEGVKFTLPECAGGKIWSRILDTNQVELEPATFKTGEVYVVTGRSVLAFGHANDEAD